MEVPAKLIIELLPNGQIAVSGPIDNKLLCYGLLECARDAIRDFKKVDSDILLPTDQIMRPQ
jgi:hypothetical protein